MEWSNTQHRYAAATNTRSFSSRILFVPHERAREQVKGEDRADQFANAKVHPDHRLAARRQVFNHLVKIISG